MSGNYKNWPLGFLFFFWNNPPECNSDIVANNEQVCMWKVSYDIHIARLGQIHYFFYFNWDFVLLLPSAFAG